MNYLDDIASSIRREVPPALVPEEGSQRLFRLYALLVLVKGESVGAKDVHDAWVAWMTEREPGHESIKPFGELTSDTKREDEPFVQAIRSVAGRL